jgi:putative intracellular protease/amidase
MKALLLSADNFEDSELLVPYYRLKEAGALYEDRELVVDANLITSRQPADLPAFIREIMKQLRL